MLEHKETLIEREKFLSEVIESLSQERNFALSVCDWPRVNSTKRRLRFAKEKLFEVSQRLAIAA